ncbi:MAG: bifunctional riboflavin kinase/FAD synthetase [Burkholderiales bacterium]|nr:bifunctional riboflavin kinase/FAD synthetase [Burkholderiales bacterium]
MQVFRGFHHPGIAPACALTIGNFDGVHRGHQAMLALLINEARHRGLPSCVLSFEPHPRDYFAALAGKPELAPLRIASLRDKLQELERCGVDQVVLLRFDRTLASLAPDAFITEVLQQGLGARYVLVGDDFRFGAKRAGDYAMLDSVGGSLGIDVARMMSYEVHGLRVSSSAVREALALGEMERVAALLGRPYSISGHVLHGRKLGRQLGASSEGADDGFRTLNLRFNHPRPAASGIYAVQVHGLMTGGEGQLADEPLAGVASLGVRPTVEDAGRVLLETHLFDWPASLGREGGYAKLLRVELLHKLRDEARYDGLEALTVAIRQDLDNARRWFANRPAGRPASRTDSHSADRRQTTRDRIQAQR